MAGRIYEAQQQHLLDLQENGCFGSDPKSWLCGDDLRDTLSSLSAAAAAAASDTGNVDRALYNDLVAMVPLVQTLIDRKTNSSFKRRGSMVYTKAPSRESIYKKDVGRSATLSAKRNKGIGDKDQFKNLGSDQDGCGESFSVYSSNTLLSEKDREELSSLRDQLETLKKQISEKDEMLRSAEISMDEMVKLRVKLEELKNEVAQKEALVKSTQSQLSDVKIKLADKQAAVEKLQWEAMTSNEKVARLQEDKDRLQGEVSDIMSLIQGLTRNDIISANDCYAIPYCIDDVEDESDCEMDLQKLEAAKEAYIAAVEEAKEKKDEESLAVAASARFHLQSIVLI